MKKLLCAVLFIALLLCSCTREKKEVNVVLGQTETGAAGAGKKMLVNASAGLRLRDKPSTEGERLGVLEHLTEVNVIREDTTIVTIGGVEGKWVYIDSPAEGWVFSGFLVNSMDQYYKSAIIGMWMMTGQDARLVHAFSGDNRWAFGLYESEFSESGTWYIEGTKLTIEINNYWEGNQTQEYEFRFINADTLRFTGAYGENTLTRVR